MTTSSDGTPHFRIAYWNPESRVLDATKVQVERLLKKLGSVEIKDVKAPDDPNLFPCDLLVVASPLIPEEDFPKWLAAQSKRIQQQSSIWLPALFVADVDFDMLQNLWVEIQRTNWYFDIVSPSHLNSLPVRVANLMRINDHLHELKRYEKELESLQQRVQEVENRLAARTF